ncbi:MAG: urease accessory protein UreD [Verrucomicrobiales bacterium]|nr:urease accessory protein UreD [Verrucomicrobiales bacterium]
MHLCEATGDTSKRPLSGGRPQGLIEHPAARLEVSMVDGQSAITSIYATNPLKLLAPVSRGTSVWAYTSSFGGGMVSGDQTALDVRLHPGVRCFLGTQSSTKVYRNPEGRPTGHRVWAGVGADSLLVVAPDPIQAFAGSVWRQRQNFFLAPDANLVVVDWLSSGRQARGERWAFTRFESWNEIHVGTRPWMMDGLVLDPRDGALTEPFRLGRFDCLALVAVVGPRLADGARRWVEEISARPVERGATYLAAGSAREGGAVLRFAGQDGEAVTREIHTGLRFLSSWLDGEPWNRRP